VSDDDLMRVIARWNWLAAIVLIVALVLLAWTGVGAPANW